MAEYITPKTNWQKTDYFNVADYNRIKNNLEYLFNEFVTYYPSITFETMADASISMRVSAYNKLPHNLYNINSKSYNLSNIDNNTYSANEIMPNNTEWNRIEEGIILLKTVHESRVKLIPRLSITLGGAKQF